MLSFTSPSRWRTTVPSPSTASTPSTWARMRAVAHDAEAAGVGGHHAADRRAVAGARGRRRTPSRPRRRGPAARRASTPGAGGDLAGEGVDRRRGGRAGAATARRRPRRRAPRRRPARCCRPAARRRRPRRAPRQHGGHLVGRAGRTTAGGAGPRSARPVDLVAGADVGVGEDVLGADDGRQRREVRGRAGQRAARARPSMDTASSSSSSVMVRGGMSRSTFSRGPHVSTSMPSSKQGAAPRRPCRRRQLDADHQPDAADLEHAGTRAAAAPSRATNHSPSRAARS